MHLEERNLSAPLCAFSDGIIFSDRKLSIEVWLETAEKLMTSHRFFSSFERFCQCFRFRKG